MSGRLRILCRGGVTPPVQVGATVVALKGKKMTNRIKQKFKELRAKKKKAFIAFLTAGYPNLKTTEELVLAFDKKGVDIVELGVPFSDPLADGPTIQMSSQEALKKGVTLEKILEMVKRIRKKSDIPIALMTYYNPVFAMGDKKFVAKAKVAGVDGVIVPDLPPEEAGKLITYARLSDLSTIFFLAPTTTKERMKHIVQASNGFIYYVSLTGVTGERTQIPKTLSQGVKAAKRITNKPICVGFGISSAPQVKSVAKIADGVIVGSAIIKSIEKNLGRKDLVQKVSRFVASLSVQ